MFGEHEASRRPLFLQAESKKARGVGGGVLGVPVAEILAITVKSPSFASGHVLPLDMQISTETVTAQCFAEDAASAMVGHQWHFMVAVGGITGVEGRDSFSFVDIGGVLHDQIARGWRRRGNSGGVLNLAMTFVT